jgi:hypothetical protein
LVTKSTFKPLAGILLPLANAIGTAWGMGAAMLAAVIESMMPMFG